MVFCYFLFFLGGTILVVRNSRGEREWGGGGDGEREKGQREGGAGRQSSFFGRFPRALRKRKSYEVKVK